MCAMSRPSALAAAVARVGDRWSLLVIDALSDAPRRFNELADAIDGIAPNTLSDRLRRLEQDGVITSEPYSRRPLRLEYRLTEDGRELGSVLRLLATWGGSTEGGAGVRHATCGTIAEARWYCPTCARFIEDERDSDVRHL